MAGFYETLDRITDLLRSEGRLSYRALKREFQLDDDLLNDIRAELVEIRQVARDVDGRSLEAVGLRASSSEPAPESSKPTPAPPPVPNAPEAGAASRRVKKTLLIWIGAVVMGAGVLMPWVHVLRQERRGGWQTVAHRTGIELSRPPFNTVLPGIALGLGVVNVFLGFFVARRSAAARFLSFLVALAGLVAVGVTAYVFEEARPGHVFRGWEGTTRNELEPGLFVTLAGGVLLFLGGLMAFARARWKRHE